MQPTAHDAYRPQERRLQAAAAGPTRPKGTAAWDPLADFACVLAAWAIGYLIRLGAPRMHVVTFFPEVAFIVLCGAMTAGVLKWRGHYAGFRTRFQLADARRIALATLAVGFGMSAVARFLDVEIISRTAILLAPPLAAGLMINWRLAVDHFGRKAERGVQPAAVTAASSRRALIIVNTKGADLTPVYAYLKDSEGDFDVYAYDAAVSGKELAWVGNAGRLQFTVDVSLAFEGARSTPDATIALPRDQLEVWRQDARYTGSPGHRFVTIESLVHKSQELGYAPE